MKILMASHYFASHKGGVEIVAGALFKGFTEKGQEVTWMASDVTPPPGPMGRSNAASLPVLNFVEDKMGLPFPIPKPAAVKTIVREVQKTDILVLHDCLYLSNILAFLTARWRGTPTVIIQHTRFFPNSTRLVNAVIKNATAIVTQPMLKRAKQVVFISDTTRKFFGKLRLRSSPEVVFNGVDSDLFRKLDGSETTSALRREFGLPDDRIVILFVGRFVEKKGISAMKRMVEMSTDRTWAFAGWGPLDPNSWNADNVRVFSDLWGPSMAALYRACDLLVLPSSGEGFPLVIQEALASGIPVVCGEDTLTADPAMGEFVRGAPVYLGDDDRTAREFLKAIDDSFASDAVSIDESEHRRDFAVSHYSWDRSVDRYMKIISRLAPKTESEAEQEKANAERGKR